MARICEGVLFQREETFCLHNFHEITANVKCRMIFKISSNENANYRRR